MKRYIIFFMILTLVLFTLVSCVEPQNPGTAEIEIEDDRPLKGGELRVACIEPNSFNPILNKSKSYGDVARLIFNGLVEYDDKQEMVLVLAETIDIEETGQVIIQLKDNILWSDGNRVTAADVKFTLDTIKSTASSIYKENMRDVSSYKIIDEGTLSIKFNRFTNNIMQKLCFPIIPMHIFAESKEATPVGTGPYKVASYEKLKHMKLVPNDCWWKKGDMYISTIKVLFINDIEAFDTAFESREIDILHAASYDWEKYRELQDVNTYKYISNSFEYISVNHQNPILRDKEIRKALMCGINRKELVDKYLLGNVSITDVPIKHSSWLFDGKGIEYNYDRTEAQYTLNNSGFSYNSERKSLEREVDGKKQVLRFTLITNSENEYRRKIAEEIKRYLEDIGFIIDLEILPFDDMKSRMDRKKYDMALVGMNIHPSQDLYSFFHSSQNINGNNYGSYSNMELDLLLDELTNDILNETRYNAYLKVQSIIREELPILSLFYKEHALVMRNKVKGAVKIDSENLFRTIDSWYINRDDQ